MNGDLQPPKKKKRHRDFQPQTTKLKPEEFTEHSYCLCKQKGHISNKIPLGMAQ